MKVCLRFLALLLFVPLAHAQFKEGTNYKLLANPQPVMSSEKIEVLELFWYGCPHCYHLEPKIEHWLKSKPEDVEFVRIPAILGPSWELLARGYYTAELLDATDKVHRPLFERLHKQRKQIRNIDQLRAFFIESGVSGEDFDATFKSFGVVTSTNRAKDAHTRYGITGVPALVVNGKYLVTSRLAGGDDKMMQVVDYLVEQERKAVTSEAQVSVR